MNDCIDILRSIGATCSSLNQIGGVDKRVWVTQLNQIESYTFDSNGYLNSLVTKEYNNSNYRYELAQIVGKKNTHSGNYEGVVGANVSFVKQNAVLKIYTDTPSDRDKVVELFDAQELVIFFENNNGKIEVYGLDKGLEGSALVGGTGTEMQDDTAVTITLTGDQNKLPYFFLYGGSLATSIEYLDNIGLQPIYYIQSYTSGTSTIDFTNNGGDDWEIGFKITPDSLQVPSGVTVDSIDYTISIWKLGVETNLDSQIVTTDASYNSVGNGAGVYASFVHYNLSDGSEFQVYRIDKVDGAGNIIASLELNGIVVNSISALTMNVTASVIQTGASYSVIWLELPTLTQVGTGGTANITVQNVSTSIGFTLDIDSVFTTDFQTSFGAVSTISIN